MAQAKPIITPASQKAEQTNPDAYALLKQANGDIVVVEPKLPASGELGVFWFKGVAQPKIARLCTEIECFPPNPNAGIQIIELEQIDQNKRYVFLLDEFDRLARVRAIFSQAELARLRSASRKAA